MTSNSARKRVPTVAHWGHFAVDVEGEDIVAVHGYDDDQAVSPIGQALLDVRDPAVRVAQPMVRRGYLEAGLANDGSRRGREPFVAVAWDEALDLAATALAEVKENHGNESIYAGSYGWASAGRFHNAQAQLHRFLNQFGGYTRSSGSYSAAAGERILPHVLGRDLYTLFLQTPPFTEVVRNTQLIVCFGGLPLKNLHVAMGGVGSHRAPTQLRAAVDAGIEFVNFSPIRSDLITEAQAEWHPIRPSTDTAVMLALCHTLLSQGLVDEAFIQHYTVGYERFVRYLEGADDGQPKDAQWASTISSVPASAIESLARRIRERRTFITMGWAMQRGEHGEQPYWAAVALMSMAGQMGLRGAGVGHGVGSIHTVGFMGRRLMPFGWPGLPEGKNAVEAVIPVARIADQLLHPGEPFDFDGVVRRYEDIRLVYWAGGNPFHQHQDLNRLRRAWAKPQTVIINEPFWTATARHADIVFPITTSLERNDVSFNMFDHFVSPMPRAVPRFADARDDYDVFCGLAERLGFGAAFSEGRDEQAWVRHIFDESKALAARHDIEIPAFDEFWAGEHFSLAGQLPEAEFILEAFRRDPVAHPLGTPSGRIEIFSDTIANFGYADCPGHPAWLDKVEWLGAPLSERYPLHLISGQPTPRLHSQLDHSRVSRATKIHGREPVTMHPDAAAARGIAAGSVVRIFNDRGACLAGVVLSLDQRADVIALATGAWYDPIDTDDGLGLCVHGNPNVLTRDVGTSKLGQGPIAHSCLVEVEPYTAPLPDVRVFSPPEIIRDPLRVPDRGTHG